MANDSHGDAPDGGRLGRFERNRFFHGKLMTARDMAVEQEYHAGRLDTLAHDVLGEGIVTGLRATVTESGSDLDVSVDPGLAIDSYGRLVLVEETDDETIEGAGDYTNGISLYLHYDQCKRETVPVKGAGDGCSQECAYNRIREGHEISHRPGPPEDGGKPVADVVFPSLDPAELNDPERPAPPPDELQEIAETYDGGTDPAEGDAESEDASVFLGYFEPDEDEETLAWQPSLDEQPRPYVYTNDMLYAAVARHAGDFNNPHEVSAEQAGALVSVDGVRNPGGDVDLHSADGTIDIGRAENVDGPHVDFALDQAIHDDVLQHGSTLEEHANTLDEHASELDEHASELGEHGSRLDEHGSTLEEHGNTLETHGTAIDEHEARLDEHQERLAENEALLEEHGATLDDHADTLDQHGATLDDHDARMDDHGNRLDRHRDHLVAHTRLELPRALKYQIESYYDLIRTFPGSPPGVAAAELVAMTADALRALDVRETDPEELWTTYIQMLDQTESMARTVYNRLQSVGGIDQPLLDRYLEALDALEDLLNDSEPTGVYVADLLVVQESLCLAARLVAPTEEEPLVLPGEFEIPRGLVNRPLRTHLAPRTGGSTGGTTDPVIDDPIITDPVITDPVINAGGDYPMVSETMPDLTGEQVETVDSMASESDARVSYETPEGESVDPSATGDYVVVDQPTQPTVTDGSPAVTLTVAEAQAVDTLSGIGGTRRDALADAGYPSVEALSKADPGEVAGALDGVSPSMAEEWVTKAKKSVESRT